MNTFSVFFRLLLNHFFQWKEISPGGCSHASCIYYQGIETARDGEEENEPRQGLGKKHAAAFQSFLHPFVTAPQ